MEKWFIGKKHITSSKYALFIEALKARKSLNEIIKMLILDPEFANKLYIEAMPRVEREMRHASRERNRKICFGNKQEPYYDDDFDEMDSWVIPEYRYEELSSSERAFYEKNK